MSSTTLYITFFAKEGPFLKIWGQLDKNIPIAIDKALADATDSFDSGHHIPPTIQYFSLGNLCCAKFSDGAYYRAKITNVDSLHDGVVEVLFIDYGNTDIIPCKNIRTMAPFSREFINIGPQAREFYLMNVTHIGTDWDQVVLDQIIQTFRYVDLAIDECIQIASNFLIRLVQNGQEISSLMQQAGYAVHVPTHIQQSLMQKSLIQKMQEPPQLRQPRLHEQQMQQQPPYSPNQYNMQQQLARPTILTFKSTPLDTNSEHEIYVSYVTDGPLLFSIQLRKVEEHLRTLMDEINTVPLQPFGDTPAPSAMCLVKSMEDGYICRGVVTNMVDGEYKIYYVDFGNTEMRSIDHIFEIPHKFIIPKLMATRFALDGFDKAVVSVHMKVAFKQFVEHRLLNIRVKTRCVKTGLPLCDIWDENGIQAIDMVKQAAFEAYSDPVQVSKGSAQPARVTSVYSCNRFYIQLKGKDNELQAIISFMQQSCLTRKPLDKNEVYPGRPCAAQLPTDNLWHRAVITEAFTDGTVRIFFVDLGSECTVNTCNLKQAHYDQMTMLRPQALQCSLNGYQNMPADKERDTFLNEILFNQEFTAKVVDLLGSLILVDMIDGKNYNVASLLLEKLANSRSQISPLLIQDSNKIEFKKRSPQERGGYNRDQRENSSFRPRESNDNRYDRPRNRDRDGGFMSRSRDDYGKPDDRFMNRDKNDSFNKNRENGFRSGNRDGGNSSGYQNKKFGRNNSGTDSGSEKEISPDKNKPYGRQNKPNDRVNNYADSANKSSRYNSRDGIPPTGKLNMSSRASDSGSDNWDNSKKGYKGTNPNSQRRDNNSDRGHYKENTSESNQFQSPPKNSPPLASIDAQYQRHMLVGTTKNVAICWFHNPGSFFIQLEESKSDLSTMMNCLQSTYKKHRSIEAVVNQAVVAEYPADKAYYRALVLEVAPGKFKVQYVDFGNISGTSKVFAIEEQHMTLPAQAVRCQLSGIKPVGGSEWPKANHMVKYFGEADEFACEFVAQLEDRFEVVLTMKNQNIADLLVADELAAHLVTLELPLLLCQEIKVLINAVNSLSDFMIEVEPNVKVQCTLHNLACATQTFEATLKELVGYFVIAFFDNIEDNKAEVTLYDTYGMKLKLIEPDEGALESISPLCSLSIFVSTVEGYVSHATTTSVFIQPSKYTTYIAQLLDAMFNLYNGVENTEPVIPEEGFEYAILSPDQNWYRGKVTAIDGDTVTVHYVDYGNDETVSISSLRILDGSLYDPHELCIEIRMNKDNESLIETELVVNVTYVDDSWTAVEKDIKEEVKSTVAVSVQEKAVVQEEVAVQGGEVSEAIYEQCGFPITVSHIESPNNFYVQLAHDLESIDALQAELLTNIDSLTDADEPVVGMLCAALYNENQEWYRAEVLGIDENKVNVRFVDYGNCDVIDNSQTKVKLLPADLQSLERYARPCSLYILPILSESNDWSAEACARFEEVAYNDGICAEIILQNDDVTYIHIYHNDVNLAETLVSENHALKMTDETVPVDSKDKVPQSTESLPIADSDTPSTDPPGISVQVSHIDSPGQFYVQLSTDLDAIDALQANLQVEIEQLADVEVATAGVLCAAMYSANQEWYRAQVLDTDVDITTVRFVDYGNTDVLDNKQSKVKTLSPELLTLEQYARRCSLYVQPSIESSDWSQEACSRFEELTYSQDIRAEIIEQDDKTTYINLFANKVNIGDVLVSEKHGQPMQFETEATYPTGFISHVNSPSEFWIQLENACGDLERIADQLERDAGTFGTLNDMSPGTLCAAVFPDDDNWYRARILSNTVAGLEVLFIDYGNSCTCTNLRELPEDLVMTPALAQKCCLQKPNGVLQWSPTATETFKEIAADGRSIFVVHKLVPGETTIVQLYLDDQDITQHLFPITVEGYVSHYEKLDSLWIRKSADLPRLEKWTVMLPNATNWPITTDIDKIVAAYNGTEATWHRAKVIEKIDGKNEYKVLLIDLGVKIISNDIREWPEDCEEDFDPLANKYKLQPLPGFKWTTESETQFQNINNNGNTIYHVEFISDEIVQLYHEMQDVRSCLDCIKSTPIASTQTTPSKKSVDNKKSGDQEENVIVEATNSDVSEIVNERVNDSVKSDHVFINQSLPDAPIPVKVVHDDIEVSDNAESEVSYIIKELVQNSIKSPEKLLDNPEIVEMANNNVGLFQTKEIVENIATSPENQPEISEHIETMSTEGAVNIAKEIVDELSHNSVKSPEKSLLDNSEIANINNTINVALNEAQQITNELVQNSVDSPRKKLFGESESDSESATLDVTNIRNEVVAMSMDCPEGNIVDSSIETVKISTETITDTAAINMSDIVEEIIVNVENTNTARAVIEDIISEINTEKCVLSTVLDKTTKLGDSPSKTLSVKEHNDTTKNDNKTEVSERIETNILAENANLDDSKAISSYILNSVVDGLD